jgi:hypothetical protein
MSISDRDLEALSAYLDGELSGKTLARLEARIETNEELRDTFEQLQHARTMMRSLPRMRAPRNYFLTLEMVGAVQKPRRAFPVLRFASVLTTLLLVLVFLGDFFMVPNLVMAPARTVQFTDSAVEEAEQPAAELPVMEMESESVESQLPEAPVEPEMDRAELEEAAAPLAAEAITSPPVESTPETEKVLGSTIPAPAEEMEGDLEGIAEAEDEPDLRIETREPISQAEDELQPGNRLLTVFRIAELILIIVALSTGLAAFFLYRKSK